MEGEMHSFDDLSNSGAERNDFSQPPEALVDTSAYFLEFLLLAGLVVGALALLALVFRKVGAVPSVAVPADVVRPFSQWYPVR
jgi:hypothetical protein